MNRVILPTDYRPKLNNHEVQLAIDLIKRIFQAALSTRLHLNRVSAPLFVDPRAGINDNLSGVERPVGFDIPAIGTDGEIVQSLAKWKRVALRRYGFAVHEGLVTDMNAIRRDEELDNLHSIYVDQWDWEKIIVDADRTVDYLKDTVDRIVEAIYETNRILQEAFPNLNARVTREVFFTTAQELENQYPDLTPQERETACAKEHGTIFIMQIGDKLRSGNVHGNRAPDYDDWSLNGDIIVWNEVLQGALELSSMGIRVNRQSMLEQLDKAGCNHRREQPYHQMVINGEVPLTIGGGIGQSRLCMFLMQCAHIGEVQSSLWDAETRRLCEEKCIPLL